MADVVETPEEAIVPERDEIVRLRGSVPDALLKVKEERGMTFLCVRREAIFDTVRSLKEESGYDHFVECLGVDYSRWDHDRDLEGRFEVVYNLYNTSTLGRLFLKIGVDDGQTVPTLIPLFLGAEYPEREIQDMFGVIFEGNGPRPSERFLLPDDWIGYPLRKEYPLGGEDVLFDRGDRGPAVEDTMMPHAGESFEGKTGSEDVSGR
ncbi:NADH-quinone oxidoreductase subunit C [bacterium]|nr:MAG: NADH-quinone oxidoreductase subunit C [bacterium]